MALTFGQVPAYLRIEIRGEWTTPNAEKAIAAIHKEATGCGLTRLLVDTREVSKPDFDLTRFATGKCWAATFDAHFRTAFIARPELFDGFAETAALNRGAVVKGFFSEAEALNWLLVEPSQAQARKAA